MTRRGKVYLVGAGPGDPELLTLKAARLISSASIVIYDRLVSEEVLALVPTGATKIDVGKRPKSHPVPQDEISAMLIGLARSGRTVVRLKGGDPFLFGRGGEEALALASAGVSYEVVPGITSAQGCAASTRIPLTHRTLATGLRFLTGHCRADGALDFDWDGLADAETTLVVYMGLANIREIASRLIVHGRAPATPVLAVSRGTQPGERRVASTLEHIAADVAAAGLESPVLFIIGEVVAIAAQLRGERRESALVHLPAAE